MSPFRRSLFVTVVLALIAGLGGGLVGARLSVPGAGEDDALHSLLHEGLALSAEQTARIAAEESAFGKRRDELERAIRTANSSLATAIRTERRDGPRVQRAIDGVHAELGRFQKETIAHIFRMRVVLTPVQAAKFDATVADALTSDAH